MAFFNFPFASLNNQEFIATNLSTSADSTNHLLDLNELFVTHNDSDGISIDSNPSLSDILTNCSYSTIDEIKDWPSYENSFSILTLNARSLIANFEKIKIFLSNFIHPPDIIAISET